MSNQPSNNRDSATFKVVPPAATVAAAPSRRDSTAPSRPALSKPTTTIYPSAIVAEKAILTGPHRITIGANSAIHPFAKIVSNGGPVTIGENVIIKERAIVGIADNGGEVDMRETGNGEVVLEDSVTIESSAVVEASTIGEGSTIDVGARAGAGARIGKYCKLSPKASVSANEVVEDFTALSYPNYRRPDFLLISNPSLRALKLKRQRDQVNLLRRLIPSNLVKWS